MKLTHFVFFSIAMHKVKAFLDTLLLLLLAKTQLLHRLLNQCGHFIETKSFKSKYHLDGLQFLTLPLPNLQNCNELNLKH